jgi:hypothetical protein
MHGAVSKVSLSINWTRGKRISVFKAARLGYYLSSIDYPQAVFLSLLVYGYFLPIGHKSRKIVGWRCMKRKAAPWQLSCYATCAAVKG